MTSYASFVRELKGRMADPLPRPTVEVTSRENGTAVDVTISRPASDGTPVGKKFEGRGHSHDSSTKNAIEKLLADPATAEWLPASRKP